MRKPPRQILNYIKNPDTWDALAFETAMRNDVENSTGPLCASDELLVSMLVMSMESLVQAQKHILKEGPIYHYNAGEAPSAWQKIRTESLDKCIKILGELALVARGRPKVSAKPSNVDELFASA